MKKIFSAFLCCMLICGVLFTAVGCSSEQSKFVGTWEATVDLSDALTDELAGEELADYMNIEDFAIVLRFTFEKDGTYEMAVDEDSVEDAFDALKDQLSAGLVSYMEDIIEANGLDMTVDEAFEAAGIDMDALLEEAFTSDMLDDMVDEFVTEGEYEVKDGKLYTYDEGEELDEDEYITYEFDGDELLLKKVVTDDEEAEEAAELLFPMTLEKVD